jgi:WD40 repeat protein
VGLATGREVRILAGHPAAVTGVTFSPDGTTLVAASGGSRTAGPRDRRAIKVWEVDSGREGRALSWPRTG